MPAALVPDDDECLSVFCEACGVSLHWLSDPAWLQLQRHPSLSKHVVENLRTLARHNTGVARLERMAGANERRGKSSRKPVQKLSGDYLQRLQELGQAVETLLKETSKKGNAPEGGVNLKPNVASAQEVVISAVGAVAKAFPVYVEALQKRADLRRKANKGKKLNCCLEGWPNQNPMAHETQHDDSQVVEEQMTVTVRALNGDILAEVQVGTNDCMSAVHNAARVALKGDRCKLFLQGREIFHKDRATECGLKHGDELTALHLRMSAEEQLWLSTTLCQILRHGLRDPQKGERISVPFDGWVRIDDLILLKRFSRRGVSIDDINTIVENCPKQRFQIKDEDGCVSIRAVKGHVPNPENLIRKWEQLVLNSLVNGLAHETWIR